MAEDDRDDGGELKPVGETRQGIISRSRLVAADEQKKGTAKTADTASTTTTIAPTQAATTPGLTGSDSSNKGDSKEGRNGVGPTETNPVVMQFIREAFQLMCAKIVGVKLTTNRGDSSKLVTYLFVEFADSDTARFAMVAAVEHTIRNDPEKGKFHLSFANSPQRTTEYNFFISNLDKSVDDANLFRIFGAKYSSCPGAKIYQNLDGTSREFGFVCFTSETDQQRALVEMNKHKGREIMIELALPKTRVGRHYLRGPNPHMSRGGAFGGAGGYCRSTGTGFLPTPSPAGQTIQIGSQLPTVQGCGPGGILPVSPMIHVNNHSGAGIGTPAVLQSYVAPIVVEAFMVGPNYAAQYGEAIIQQAGGIDTAPALMNTPTSYGTDMSTGGWSGHRSSSGQEGYHHDSSYSSSRYATTSRRRFYNSTAPPKLTLLLSLFVLLALILPALTQFDNNWIEGIDDALVLDRRPGLSMRYKNLNCAAKLADRKHPRVIINSFNDPTDAAKLLLYVAHVQVKTFRHYKKFPHCLRGKKIDDFNIYVRINCPGGQMAYAAAVWRAIWALRRLGFRFVACVGNGERAVSACFHTLAVTDLAYAEDGAELVWHPVVVQHGGVSLNYRDAELRNLTFIANELRYMTEKVYLVMASANPPRNINATKAYLPIIVGKPDGGMKRIDLRVAQQHGLVQITRQAAIRQKRFAPPPPVIIPLPGDPVPFPVLSPHLGRDGNDQAGEEEKQRDGIDQIGENGKDDTNQVVTEHIDKQIPAPELDHEVNPEADNGIDEDTDGDHDDRNWGDFLGNLPPEERDDSGDGNEENEEEKEKQDEDKCEELTFEVLILN